MSEAVTVNRSSRRREQTRRQLTAAARDLIRSKGVAGLRIGDITETADVGRGSFYNHFNSKEELVDAVVAESLAELASAIIAGIPQDADAAVGACIANRRFLRLAYDDPAYARLVVNLAHDDTVFADAVRPFARGALERGIESGRFRIADLDMALIILIGSALEIMRAILRDSAPADADMLHAESMLILFGLPADEAREISRRPLV